VKDPTEAYFDGDSIRVPSARQTKYRDKRANPLGKIPGDVWEFSRVCGTFSERVNDVPTQLPEKLVHRMISCSTALDDPILDLFSGSGTISSVAKSLGRESVAFEINPSYADIARARLSKVAPPGAD
jgi:DNA modification methylase